MKEERKKGTHLTLEERHQIQEGLRWHRSFTENGEMIGYSPDAEPMRKKETPEVPDFMPEMYGV